MTAVALFVLSGQAASAGEGFESFDALRRHHAGAAFEATAAYLSAHPDAPDAEKAYEFLFETALDFGLVREARPHAERFLKDHPDAGVSDKSRARRVAMLALALEGQTEPAIDVLGEELAAVRRLDPSAAIDAATALAAAVQRGGQPAEASQVYERLRRAFFLNAGVEAVVENRLARLALLDQPVPPIGVPDLDGRQVAPEDVAGKVVLIDFWATNCPPCLEELPELRRLHADHQDAGFEILAVSLDEEEATLREYLSRNSLPWRVFLSTADGDATREAFGVETIPANFLVGPDGKVARVDLHGADLRAEVERLLGDHKK
jgi:thiol-disulfide isomerase/thioredoxin